MLIHVFNCSIINFHGSKLSLTMEICIVVEHVSAKNLFVWLLAFFKSKDFVFFFI